MTQIDPTSPLPLHAQISQGIILAIARGEFRKGHRLPTVRELAVDLKVNSNTVARVYLDLERQGILETRRGLGTFVLGKAPSAAKTKADRLHQLCRGFIEACMKEGFSLRELRSEIAQLSKTKGR
jgi:GntR family transcriptional regulator